MRGGVYCPSPSFKICLFRQKLHRLKIWCFGVCTFCFFLVSNLGPWIFAYFKISDGKTPLCRVWPFWDQWWMYKLSRLGWGQEEPFKEYSLLYPFFLQLCLPVNKTCFVCTNPDVSYSLIPTKNNLHLIAQQVSRLLLFLIPFHLPQVLVKF